MKRSRRVFALSLAAAILILVFGAIQHPAVAEDGGAIKWRLSSSFPVSSLSYKFLERLAAEVKNRTNGKFIIAVHPAGALCKPFENFDAVSKGVVQLAYSVGWYHGGKMPLALVEGGLPMSYTSPPFSTLGPDRIYEFYYDFKGGEAWKILQAAYGAKGIEIVGVAPTGGFGFETKFIPKSVEDFKGKKIRTAGLFSQLVKNMGAVPVQVPGSEQYLALQRGLVDGTVFVYFGLDIYKLKEVVKAVTVPALLCNALTSLYANQKAWNGLSDGMKKALRDSWKEISHEYAKASMISDKSSVEAAQKSDVKVVELSDPDMEKLLELAMPIWDEVAKKNEDCAKLVALLKEFYVGKKYSK